MVTNLHLQSDVFRDVTIVIGCTIGIEDGNGVGKFLGVDAVFLHKFYIYAGSFTAAVE